MKWFADIKSIAFSGAYSDLSGTPTSMPANGGNSDTVDGKHASDFATATQGEKADTALQSFTETDPTVSSWAKASNKPTYTKYEVGLGNVDNTSDANKPISAAAQTALNGKEPAFTKNTAFNKNFGTATGTVCQGNDSRLSDSRPANGGTSSACAGNSATATKLQTARKIAGTSFDGSTDIPISYNNLSDKPTIPSGVTITDNLASTSTTSSLSANMGKALNDTKANKTVISQSQPSTQSTDDIWEEIID